MISQTVLPDGAQVEQSLFYHDYELSFLVEIQDWIRRHPDAALATGDLSSGYDFGICQNGTTFDNHIDPDPNLDLAAVVQAATRVATHTAMPSTEVPMLGSSPTCNLQTFWATSFGAYVEHDTSDVVQQFQFVRSGGASGVSIPLSQRMQVFPNAGYVTLRSAFAPSYAAQTHVLFNVGVPANAHSHLDALSLHLYAQDPTTAADNDGLPLLTDSGWFSYTNSQRHYFESTGAHSTVTVDGLNQCSFDPTGKRADPTSPSSILGNCAAIVDGYPMSRAHLGSSLSDPGGLDRVLYQSAETSLYAGVTHQRGVALFGRDLVLVLDHLKSASTHSLQQNWQLGPAVASIGQATASGNTAHYLFRGANGAALFSGHFAGASDSAFSTSRGTCGSCTGNLCAGNECADPRRGWFSLVENSKTPSWALQRQGTAKEVTWASAFLLGGLAAQNATVTLTRLATNDYQLDATVQDGMTVSVRVDGFATAAEAVDISYPLRGAFASYSFEGNPATNQDLKEDLAVSISAAGETNDNVVSRAGVVGRAYEYASGGTQLGSGGSFAFMHKPGAKFSLSFWLRMASTNSGATGGTQAIFSTGTWSNTGTGIQLYFQDDASHDNTLRFVVRGGGSTPVSFQSPARFIPEDTLWHHYVVAFEAAASSDQIHLYRDGANGVTAQFSGNLSTAANDASPTLGKKPGTGVAFPLHASLDEFVFFKRALSGADAMALFNGGQGMRAH